MRHLITFALATLVAVTTLGSATVAAPASFEWGEPAAVLVLDRPAGR